MPSTFFRREIQVAFAVFALALALGACGVKGPPLPPISAGPPEEKSLGRRATPIAPLPSPTPPQAGAGTGE